MATIVKRGKKYSVVYNYTDENGVQRQKWEPPVATKKRGLSMYAANIGLIRNYINPILGDVLELAKLLSENPALAAMLAGILKNGTA